MRAHVACLVVLWFYAFMFKGVGCMYSFRLVYSDGRSECQEDGNFSVVGLLDTASFLYVLSLIRVRNVIKYPRNVHCSNIHTMKSPDLIDSSLPWLGEQ